MAIGSGKGASLGCAVQTSSYDTRVAPDTFLIASSYSINRTQNRVQGEGILSGAYGDLLDHYVETTNGAVATIAADVPSRGMGKWLNTLMGSTVTATQISTTGIYTQAHTMGNPLGKYLTIQLGAPYRSGTVPTAEIVGAKCTSMEFTAAVDDVLKVSMQFDGHSFASDETLASPSFVSSELFPGSNNVLKLGTFESETAVSGVRSFSCVINRSMDTEDYVFNNSGRKGEPVLEGVDTITGSVTVDWLDKTVFQDRVENNTDCSLVFETTANTAISGTYVPTFRITLPSVVWSGDMQGVDSKGALQSTWNFEWKYDGTNLPVVTYIAADSSL